MRAYEIQPGSQLDRAVGAMVGLAVGDALGTTLQFAARDTLPPVTDMVGGGPFDLPPGHWSDATSMALCLADAVIDYELGRVTCENADWHLTNSFRQWWQKGCYTLSGRCLNIGDAMRWSLGAFVQSKSSEVNDAQPAEETVRVNDTSTHHTSNDSLKRLAPIAVRWSGCRDVLEEAACRQNATTHRGSESEDACVFYARLLAKAIVGKPVQSVLRSRKLSTNGKVAAVAAGSWREKTRDEIYSTNCVVHTLEAALWALEHGSASRLFVPHVNPYRQSVLAAVNLGGDTSAVGAVTGQLAGALWGLSGIPSEWVETLAHSERIIELAEKLHDPPRPRVAGDWLLIPDFDPGS